MLTLYYPKTNIVGRTPDWQSRQFARWSVRDLVTRPLTPEEYLNRPLVRRSRYLWQGRDSLGQWRKFYLGATRDHWHEAQLRIALYDGARRIRLLSRPFEATVRDRILLARVIGRWESYDYDGLQLRITCDDLRVFGR
jgi:hypothetical protein